MVVEEIFEPPTACSDKSSSSSTIKVVCVDVTAQLLGVGKIVNFDKMVAAQSSVVVTCQQPAPTPEELSPAEGVHYSTASISYDSLS